MMSNSTAGYSGTALAKKLGIKDSHRVLLLDAPNEYESLLAPLPPGVVFAVKASSSVVVAQLFVTQQEDLLKHLATLRKKLAPEAGALDFMAEEICEGGVDNHRRHHS